jgi:hypothetical protein
MTRSIPVGEMVTFTMNTGQEGRGQVIQRIAERRQPVILLIEQANGWRCFRLEEDVTPAAAGAPAMAAGR